MARRGPKVVPRSQRRKEAKAEKKQRRVDYFTKRTSHYNDAKNAGDNNIAISGDSPGEISSQKPTSVRIGSLKSALKPTASKQSRSSSHEGLQEGSSSAGSLVDSSEKFNDTSTTNLNVENNKRKCSDLQSQPKAKKILRWCPTVVPNKREGLESGDSDDEEIINSSDEEKRECLGLPTSLNRSKIVKMEPSHRPAPVGDEDAEIAYLERQLGLKEGSKRRGKLVRELTALDGFDSDFMDFTESCLKDGNIDVGVEDSRNDASETEGSLDEAGDDVRVVGSGVEDDGSVVESEDNESVVGSGVEDDESVVGSEDNESVVGSDAEDEDDIPISAELDEESQGAGVEDVEIQYLEKQLGLRGEQGRRKKEKLMRELMALDGLDVDILSLAEDCLKPGIIGSKNTKGSGAGGSGAEESEAEESEAEESEAEGSGAKGSEAEGSEAGDSEVEDSGGELSNATEDFVEVEDDNNESDAEGIIGHELEKKEKNGGEDLKPIGKYIPPALRSKSESLKHLLKTSTTDRSEIEQNSISAAISKVEIKLTGLVNRISDGNLSPIASQIGDEVFTAGYALAQKYYFKVMGKKNGLTNLPTPALSADASASFISLLSTRLSKKVISVSVESLSSTVSLIACQSACISALTARVSFRICQQHIVELIKSFENNWTLIQRLIQQSSKSGGTTKKSEMLLMKISTTRKFLRFAVTSLALLFDFGLLDASAIFSFVRRLFEDFALKASEASRSYDSIAFETQIDLLLTCLRHAGVRLRSGYSDDFKEILIFLAEVTKDFDSSGSRNEGNNRLTYLLRELDDLKNGKINLSSTDRLTFIRSWLSNGREFEGVQWANFLFSLGPIDRGSSTAWHAVAENRQSPICALTRFESDNDSKRLAELSKIDKTDDRLRLIQYAEDQRLHTDIQKNIFVALMGSENPEHAVQRILEVGHRKNQVPHVVAVILHTSLRQRVFNPFFSQVLCDISLLPSALGKRFKRAVRQGVAAQLSTCHHFPLMALLNFGRLIAYLCLSAGEILELRVIRFLNNNILTDPEEGVSGKLGLFLCKICVDFCEIEGSTSEEVEMIDRLFEQQIRSIAVIEDISGYISSIVRSLVIPELRKKEIALNKAKQILAILKGG